MQRDRLWLFVPAIAIAGLAFYGTSDTHEQGQEPVIEAELPAEEPQPAAQIPAASALPRKVPEEAATEEAAPVPEEPEPFVTPEPPPNPCGGDAALAALYFEDSLELRNSDRRVTNIQRFLKNEGLYLGPLDGVLGPATRHAIIRYQEENGKCASGYIDAWVLRVTSP